MWAQKDLPVVFAGLEINENMRGIYMFQFDIDADPSVVSEMLSNYMNQNAVVEPKAYDQKMNNLRDNLHKMRN